MSQSLAQWYKTWRHGRGFGVHSPLAYRLLREVLRPRSDAAYYGETRISELFASRSARRTAACVFRLLADRNPTAVAIIARPDERPRWQSIVALVLPKAQISDCIRPDSEFIIADCAQGLTPPPQPSPEDARGVFTVFTSLDDSDLRAIFDSQYVDGDFPGLVLDSRRKMGLAIQRRGLPRQLITARF